MLKAHDTAVIEPEAAPDAQSASLPITRVAPSEPPDTRIDAPPPVVADWMIAALVTAGSGTASLDPSEAHAELTLRRGNATTFRASLEADLAAATIARLAKAAGLDPLAARGSPTESLAARRAVRIGKRRAEILVTTGATPAGMSIELRLLTLDGRAIDARPVSQLKRCPACGSLQSPLRTRCDHDGRALREVADDPRPGGSIGAYVLRSLLGQGSVGYVYAAEHALIGRRVAIKVLRSRLAIDPAFEARFLFEARAASRLHHPNLVEVTDYGVLEGGSPYIVMEWLSGDSLEHRIDGGRAIEALPALRIARAVAAGLAAAHDGGVVHNDLKPSNVMIAGELDAEAPMLKVIDFGAASGAGIVDDGVVVGTAAYMAPERIRGEPADARSDVYSFGVMLHRMLGGALPFNGANSTEIFQAHLRGVPPPVTSPFGVLPSRVVRLVLRALECKPTERYQAMGAMIADLDRAIRALSATGWQRWLP